MPMKTCSNSEKIIAQTLFLGASVANFTNSIGWGSQPSQLTINLIDDSPVIVKGTNACGGNRVKIFPDFADGDTANHYYNNDNPYMVIKADGSAEAYDDTKHDPKDRVVPGKVYHDNLYNSYYWKNSDPGFFGEGTILDTSMAAITSTSGLIAYDIIDVPVYFRMGNFRFGGLVQSWQTTLSNSGKGYTVTINSMQSLLNQCYLILDKFGGAMYSRLNNSSFGGSPKNYFRKESTIDYNGLVRQGNVPNVFNIYGFLESHGVDNYGPAKRNEQGIAVQKILNALSVLTGATGSSNGNTTSILLNNTQGGSAPFSNWAHKSVFSPYGRIIAKSMQVERVYGDSSLSTPAIHDVVTSSFYSHGIVPPTQTLFHTDARVQFVLDLSELPIVPDSFRIAEPVISIMDLLNLVGEQTGHDIYIDCFPLSWPTDKNNGDGKTYNVIKVKAISRLTQPGPFEIHNAVMGLACKNYSISNYTLGREKNEKPLRQMVIGGSQQRLYQAKSYRLAYTQTNFVLNPSGLNFVNYNTLGRISDSFAVTQVSTNNYYHHGKYKFPNFLSVRNKPLITYYGTLPGASGNVPTGLLNEENEMPIANSFNIVDGDWSDTAQTSPSFNGNSAKPNGNYDFTKYVLQKDVKVAWGTEANQRWIPIYLDVICPFFGFVSEEELTIKNTENNDLRQIRPVWFDSWTGQSAVVVRKHELPEVSVDLSAGFYSVTATRCAANQNAGSFRKCMDQYGNDPINFEIKYIMITESEIRAALAGFDNFLVYELSKYYKPDLIEVVRLSYYVKIKRNLVDLGHSADDAESMAASKTDWYWKMSSPNIANDGIKPGFVAPSKNSGASYLPEDAVKDLQILHKFICDIGKNYGKKYMVTAPYLNQYKDETASIALPTYGGYAYIFSGDGKIFYNYEPTNDGGWEEYGNFIDDTICVGSPAWYNLSDDTGKIKPLLGYNASKYFDYVRYMMCELQSTDIDLIKNDEKISAYWDWETYLNVIELYNITCDHTDYLFPSLDYATLNSDQYIIQKVYDRIVSPSTTIYKIQDTSTAVAGVTAPTKSKAYDAFGKIVSDGLYEADKEKLYVNATVDENFIYIYPEKLMNPKILIDSPGIYLNHSSSQYAQDPNRTVMANATIEDLLIYLHVTQSTGRDYDWIRYMLQLISPINKVGSVTNTVGNYGDTSNQSALRVEISPKAAHPFFAGIPIKSNQFSYGPWINNPARESAEIYTSGNVQNQDCTVTLWNPVANNAIDNWIGPNEVEVLEEMVPWSFGGASQLDSAAYRYIETKINYQPVIETAQVEMPGLPLFSLASVFSTGNAGIFLKYVPSGGDYTYTEYKYTSSFSFDLLNTANKPGGILSTGYSPIGSLDSYYRTLIAKDDYAAKSGPILTNIQTSVGAQGISTTYSFRTYSRKLGLFNRETSELIKKNFKTSFIKNKQIAQLGVQAGNAVMLQRDALDKQRLESSINFNTESFRSKLFGTSPSTVLIGNSSPFIQEPTRDPKVVVDFTRYTNPGDINTKANAATSWTVPTGSDKANKTELSRLTNDNERINLLSLQGRHKTSVGLYERKEVDSELKKQFGLKSAMSLDGLLSPISFYPTFKNSTFAYSLYDYKRCPFCNGTKFRNAQYMKYANDGSKTSVTVSIYCDRCTTVDNKLNAKLNNRNSYKNNEKLPPYIITDSSDINTLLKLDSNINPSSKKLPPINLVTLNPIVISHGEFKNKNSQNYIGNHPEGVHGDLKGGGFTDNRPFVDKLRHSIEIVGRGSIPPGSYGYALETSSNLLAFKKHAKNITSPRSLSIPQNNMDYYNYDSMLAYYRGVADKASYNSDAVEMNYRFFSLRGPLTMHGWGYDTEGYPVPNACDEPYELDASGRPKRFKLKAINLGDTTYGKLNEGDLFQLTGDTTYYTKTNNGELLPALSSGNDTTVTKYKIIDDYSVDGGFDPTGTNLTDGYKGSIISKTQKFLSGSGWTDKYKLKEFHLNWAERQDLWPVGPIDMRWDSDRRLWTSQSQDSKLYKFVYVTLEEDLVKEPDYDETYPTRGFLDDIEYNQEPLPNGYRRLVYVKDKSGYTAPKGTKLLCRYNPDNNYYEPISKPILIAKGKIASPTTVNIEMHYVQGRKSGTVPVTLVTFSNPLGFTAATDDVGIFTYINGIWTLTAKK